ncbi:MAG: OstA-like protein [Bacteroidia bacterium]
MAQTTSPTQPPQNQPQPGPPPQGGNNINIESADLFHFASFGADSIRIRKLIGNVVLSQDTTRLFCDSAYQFIDSNYVEAFSHVVIVMNAHMPDSMRRVVNSDRLTFDGDTKIINFWDHVVLRDKDVTLKTPRLTYYRIEDFAEYLQGGVIENDSNTLTSKRGYYYPKTDMAFFRNDVVLVNPDFTLTTDTLGYNTETKIAYFMAPTVVKDSVNNMYTEDGYYDTEADFVFLNEHSSIGDTTYTLFADTILYDQKKDLGRAIGHVRVEQKDSSLTVYGKYGEFQSKTEASFVTDSAFAVQRMESDTLYLFADTLNSYKDTVTDKRYFEAYHNASYFMNDIQGVCDSLVYWYDDSTMFFYRRPAMWSDNSQITGDTIIMQMVKGGIDSMSIPSEPYIITQEDTVGFDQIRGKHLHAKFDEKKLKTMWVYGNSESIYYTKDDHDEYLGMNRARCSDMVVNFKDNKPSRILFKDKPEGEFFPIHMVIYKPQQLEGFEWRGKERPEYPEWVVEKVAKLQGRVDSLELRLDSALLSLEMTEYEILDLLNDSLLEPFMYVKVGKDTAHTDTAAVTAGDTLAIGQPHPGDTLGVAIGPEDTLFVDPTDTIAKPHTGATASVNNSVPKNRTPAGLYQPWEIRVQRFDRQGNPIRIKRTDPVVAQPRPDNDQGAPAGGMDEGQSQHDTPSKGTDGSHAGPKTKQKRSFKERLQAFRDGWRAFRKQMKDGPTKEQIAAKKKAKLEKEKAKVKRRAEKMERRLKRKARKKRK